MPDRRSALRAVPALAVLLAACGSAVPPSAPRTQAVRAVQAIATATAAAPVVVELYQSQGCSSCPPANANLNALADRPEVLALSFGVTYWDQLGWTDSFARPEYTGRQWDYARAAGRGQVATPQVVINGGRETVVGANAAQLSAAIERAGSPRGGPVIAIEGGAVALSAGKGAAGKGAPATVWLVRYDPRVREVAIRAGENGGRTLPHRDVVRQLAKLGEWTGAPARFRLPAPSERGLRTAVLVQQGKGGPITAARRV